jgi:hypothetical protein
MTDQSPTQSSYQAEYERSMRDPEGFWGEAAEALHWDRRWERVLDDSRVTPDANPHGQRCQWGLVLRVHLRFRPPARRLPRVVYEVDMEFFNDFR